MGERTYIAIDLKSFYASVECVERGLDPLTTHLVVADGSRTEKTICLAVSPALKAYGVPGRPRLFEVAEAVREINARRRKQAPGQRFTGSSWKAEELAADPALELTYVTAPPRMAQYIRYSTGIFNIYLQYVAPEDIHVYSVDEVFMDVTDYLASHPMGSYDLARTILREVLHATGITATAGVGTNLYLCKIAMDIVAKHTMPDAEGVRIAKLDEESYRRLLWTHRPLTDFWRVGRGIAAKLEAHGMYTMGDVARCSLGGPSDFYNEELLYRLFGVNAGLLIDHAWGWEDCTIADIKAYRPESNSVSSGQVLMEPYDRHKTRIIVREMTDQLTLDLLEKGQTTDQLTLTLGYDAENLLAPDRRAAYQGPVTRDPYGREIPHHAHGTARLSRFSSSAREIMEAMMDLFDRIADPALLVRRVTVTADHLTPAAAPRIESALQLDLFAAAEEREREERAAAERAREHRRQQAVLAIRSRYGKNAILKGVDLEDGATAMERNRQIGGHKA